MKQVVYFEKAEKDDGKIRVLWNGCRSWRKERACQN